MGQAGLNYGLQVRQRLARDALCGGEDPPRLDPGLLVPQVHVLLRQGQAAVGGGKGPVGRAHQVEPIAFEVDLAAVPDIQLNTGRPDWVPRVLHLLIPKVDTLPAAACLVAARV